MDTKQMSRKLKLFVNELKKYRARHTEFISVYIPRGYELNKIIQHLAEEQGTASNIKDKNTRTNVIDALEKLIRHLRLYTKTPENGLAAFSGNMASQEGKQDFKVWSIEPPQPLQVRLYRCDQTFVLNILEDMLDIKDTYGLIAMDNRDGAVGLLKGTNITLLRELTSGVPGKIKAGGQSQARYARLREWAAHEFYQRIAEVVNKEFLMMGNNLKGVLIGGPGMTKENFVNGNYINNEIKKKIIAIQDLSYTGEFGLHELVDKSQNILAKEDIMKEKKIMQEFFKLLSVSPDKVAYGESEVKKALDAGAVEKLLISDAFEGAGEFESLAEATGAEVHFISTETREGVQLKDMGGLGAILRYSMGN